MSGDYHVPLSMNYSLGIQQSIGYSTVLDVSYVGNQVRHLMWDRPINSIARGAHFNSANMDPTNPGKPMPDNFLRPYLGWGTLTLREFNSTSNYNSMQASVRRQFSKGMMFAASYTWAKALGFTNPSFYMNPRDWNYGLLTMDRNHMLVINYVYDIPDVAKGHNAKWLSGVTGLWRLSGVTTFSTGATYTPTFTTTYTSDITGSTETARITVVGDANLAKDKRSWAQNFNTSAFALTPVGSFGNAGIGVLRGPGVSNYDITLSKKIPLGLGEKRVLEFRAEGYNALNHTQYSTVDSAARFDATGKQVNANFGAFNAARNARIMAFSLRFLF